jgi:hypothetical protein
MFSYLRFPKGTQLRSGNGISCNSSLFLYYVSSSTDTTAATHNPPPPRVDQRLSDVYSFPCVNGTGVRSEHFCIDEPWINSGLCHGSCKRQINGWGQAGICSQHAGNAYIFISQIQSLHQLHLNMRYVAHRQNFASASARNYSVEPLSVPLGSLLRRGLMTNHTEGCAESILMPLTSPPAYCGLVTK